MARGRGHLTAFFVPGRIEVLGKHTDYAGGRSLLCAIDRGLRVTVAPRSDALVRVTDRVRSEERTVPLAAHASGPTGDWSNYVATVARRVAANFPTARRGADISFESNLPAASGLSSSSALVVAIWLALDSVNELSTSARYRGAIGSPEALAAYLASVEMGGDFGSLPGETGVGTLGGSEDHTAILCCRAGFLSRYSFIPTQLEGEIPFPSDKSFVVAFSGVAAPKTERALDAYNEVSLGARRVLELWNGATRRSDKSLGSAVRSSAGAPDRIRRLIEQTKVSGFTNARLRERFDQFVFESDIVVPQASDAFARADWPAFGAIVDKSQTMADGMLRNQVPETLILYELARQTGALASSAFGGGFGGSVWALVNSGTAEEFMNGWRIAYELRRPEAAKRAEFFVTRPGPSALATDFDHDGASHEF